MGDRATRRPIGPTGAQPAGRTQGIAVATTAMLHEAVDKLRVAASRVGVVPSQDAAWVLVTEQRTYMHTLVWRGRGFVQPVPLFPEGRLGSNRRTALVTLLLAVRTLDAVPIHGLNARGERVGPRESLVDLSIALTTSRPFGWNPEAILEDVVTAANELHPGKLKFKGKLQ